MKTKNTSLLEAFANQKNEIDLSKIYGGMSYEPTLQSTWAGDMTDSIPDTRPDSEAIY